MKALKNSKVGGVSFVLQKPNNRSFFFQKMQHTSVGDSTNVQFVEKHLGCKVDGHLQKVFTSSKNSFILKKFCLLLTICSYFSIFFN